MEQEEFNIVINETAYHVATPANERPSQVIFTLFFSSLRINCPKPIMPFCSHNPTLITKKAFFVSYEYSVKSPLNDFISNAVTSNFCMGYFTNICRKG